MAITRATGKRMKPVVRKLERGSLAAMVKRGLKVSPVSPEALAEWRAETEKVYPVIRGQMIPADNFDKILRLRDEYREAKGGSSHARR